MFGPNAVNSTLTISKVLGGISKALGIANQAIPIYKEIKPMIGNVRKVMSVLKEFNQTDTTKKDTIKKVEEKKEVITPVITSSNPVFFQ